MKRFLPFILLPLALSQAALPQASASSGIDINIHAGLPLPAPPPLPRIVIQEPPLFLAPPALGFRVAVGVPYDMVNIGGRFYLYDDGRWYRSGNYRGPWVFVRQRELPPGLRRHRYDRIRYLRDEEYRHYSEDRDHYRGGRFRPERHDERREERERWNEGRRDRGESGHGRHRHDDD